MTRPDEENSTPGLAAEDAAVYGYGLLRARAADHVLGAVDRMLGEHRARRDRAAELWPDSPAPPVGYLLDTPLESETDALLLAVRIESDCCDSWRAQAGLGGTEDELRFCVDSLTAAAVQLARWRSIIPNTPFEDLPGFPRE